MFEIPCVSRARLNAKCSTKKVYEEADRYRKERTTYYNTRIAEEAGNLQRITEYTYDEANRRSIAPLSTTTYDLRKDTGQQSDPLTTSKTYDYYGNVLTSTNPDGIVTTYQYDPNTYLLTSVLQPITSTQARYGICLE